MNAALSVRVPVIPLALAVSLIATGIVRGAAAPAAAPDPGLDAAGSAREPLDYAFRFASAIASDPGDRDKEQLNVVGDYIETGALDEAARRADAMPGWRRGAAFADLAGALAKAGRAEEARTFLGRAVKVRESVDGWENPRIGAHIAQALAILGEPDRSREIATELATEDRQYAGRSVATVASAQARGGDFAGAMQTLAAIEPVDDFDVAWWRTVGYADLARQAGVSKVQRAQALRAARRSADGIAGWKKAEALESLATQFRDHADAKSAREALKTAERVVLLQPDTIPWKAPLLSNLARAWGSAGETRHARVLLDHALRTVDSALVIDRPGIYANVAASTIAIGDAPAGRRILDQAIGAAATLENARPRALAAVAICRALGQHGVALDDASRARLDLLLSNLKAPW